MNDGVMGGVSDGRFKITTEKALDFFGTLSPEDNGGFASVEGMKPVEPVQINGLGFMKVEWVRIPRTAL